MKKRILWLGLSFLLVAALVLAACGPAVPVGEQEEEEEEVVVPVPGEPVYGGTLTAFNSSQSTSDPTDWDCARSGWTQGTAWKNSYLQTLLTGDVGKGLTGTAEWDYAGRYVPSHTLKGQVAESWEFLDDPWRLVFYIRQGIKWQECAIMDERELTSADVMFSLDRRRFDPKTGTLEDPTQWFWVDSIEATDRYTVTFFINAIYPDWHFWVGLGFNAGIEPYELLDAGITDWRNHIGVGTGPLLLDNYVSGTASYFKKNPNYWDTTIVNGKEYPLPFVDEWIRVIMPDESVRLAALRTGKLDICANLPWHYMDSLAETNPGLLTRWVDAFGYGHIHMRQDTPPFDDIRVRSALNKAIDKQVIIDTLCGGIAIMDNFHSAESWGEDVWTPMSKQPLAVQELYSYDPVRARELLDEAGIAIGAKFECAVVSRPFDLDVMSLVADYWDAVDVELVIVPVDIAASWGLRTGHAFKHMYFTHESAPSPFNGLHTDWVPGSFENNDMYDDPYYNETLAYMDAGADGTEAGVFATIKLLNDYVVAGCNGGFIPYQGYCRFWWPWVNNYAGEHQSCYNTDCYFMTVIWIDQTMKTAMGY